MMRELVVALMLEAAAKDRVMCALRSRGVGSHAARAALSTDGRVGRGSTMKMNDASQDGSSGGRSGSSVGLLRDCAYELRQWRKWDSGDGAGALGASCAGDTDGANGSNIASGQSGCTGQGKFSDRVWVFKLSGFSAGSVDAGESEEDGGRGSVLLNGEGPEWRQMAVVQRRR